MNYYLIKFKINAATDWHETVHEAESEEDLIAIYLKSFPHVQFAHVKHLPYPEGYSESRN
jgi:allantoicase